MKKYRVVYEETAIVQTTRIVEAENEKELRKGEWTAIYPKHQSSFFVEPIQDGWMQPEEEWEVKEYEDS